MKHATVLVILILLLYACKKNVSNIDDKPVSNIATSIHISYLSEHKLKVDSFVRDNNNRLIKLIRIFVDSTSIPVKPTSDYFEFNYSGNDTLPDQYTYSGGLAHILRYDGQKRIIVDSATTGHIIYYFSYASSKIFFYLDLLPSIGHFEDTLNVQNENIAEWQYSYFAPTYRIYHINSYTYSSLANPLSFHGSMGILLFDITGEEDFYSKNLISDSTTWITDQNGRVIRGENIITGTGGSVTKNIITYKYD
jgi:hypothetical protein